MSIRITYKNSDLSKEQQQVINHFVEFLYDKMPVKNIKDVIFVGRIFFFKQEFIFHKYFRQKLYKNKLKWLTMRFEQEKKGARFTKTK